jgi:hypothetical protein
MGNIIVDAHLATQVHEYLKIPCLFMRDPNNHNSVIKDSYTSPELEYLRNNMWSFTEKIDGTNTRIYWDGHSIAILGHTAISNLPLNLYSFMISRFVTPEMEEVFEQVFGATPVVIYGEGFGAKVQKGGGLYVPDHESVNFRCFDIWIGGYYLREADVDDICGKLGITRVPHVLNGTIQDGIDWLMDHSHALSTFSEAPIEGLVGRLSGVRLLNGKNEPIMVKLKHHDLDALYGWDLQNN